MNAELRTGRKWAVGLGIVLSVVTTIPYWMGYALENDAWKFTGFVFGVEDGNSYIAKMLSGSMGAWLFRTPYTAYPQKGVIAFIPYLLLGKLVSAPGLHEQMVVLFHLFRWFGILVMCAATYEFISFFIQSPGVRKFATIMAIAGGGLGWLYAVGAGGLWGGRLPLEYYSPETFGFLSIYGLPHLTWARAFLLLALLFFVDLDRPWWAPGLFLLALGLMQPVTVGIAWCILGAFIVLHVLLARYFPFYACEQSRKKEYFRRFWIALGLSSPALIYNFASLLNDPFLASWAKQNRLPSPPVSDYGLAIGLFLPLVLAAFYAHFKKKNPKNLMVFTWILLLFPMVYFPISIQRRLFEGGWVALVVAASLVLEELTAKNRRIAFVILSTNLLPAVILIMGGVMAVRSQAQPLFLPAEIVQGYDYLAREASPGDVVAAGYEVSNALPAWAPVRTLIGHGPESQNISELQPEIEKAIAGGPITDKWRTIVRQLDVRYMITPKGIPGGELDNAGYRIAYENQRVRIYYIEK